MHCQCESPLVVLVIGKALSVQYVGLDFLRFLLLFEATETAFLETDEIVIALRHNSPSLRDLLCSILRVFCPR